MAIRFVGALAVIIGFAGLGMYHAAKEGFRLRELQELKRALLILASEIEYMRAPLHLACQSIAGRTSGTVANFFGNFAQRLAQGEGETTYTHWVAALECVKPTTFMTREDMLATDNFGKTLGYLDKQMQKNAIDYTVAYIDEQVDGLYANGSKTTRMYRSLGIIAGLLTVIVLW